MAKEAWEDKGKWKEKEKENGASAAELPEGPEVRSTVANAWSFLRQLKPELPSDQ